MVEINRPEDQECNLNLEGECIVDQRPCSKRPAGQRGKCFRERLAGKESTDAEKKLEEKKHQAAIRASQEKVRQALTPATISPGPSLGPESQKPARQPIASPD